jgi:hypothetical protein
MNRDRKREEPRRSGGSLASDQTVNDDPEPLALFETTINESMNRRIDLNRIEIAFE